MGMVTGSYFMMHVGCLYPVTVIKMAGNVLKMSK